MSLVLFMSKASSPAGFAVDLSPQAEVKSAVDVAQRHLSIWGRDRPEGPGEGTFQ